MTSNSPPDGYVDGKPYWYSRDEYGAIIKTKKLDRESLRFVRVEIIKKSESE